MKILAARSETTLTKLIEKARIAYYRGQPTMTDLEYDKLEDELRALNPKAAILKHSGATVPTKMKVRLPYPLPSLSKRKYRTGAVGPWLQENPGPYVVSWKIDGVSGLKVDLAKGTRLFTRGRSGDREGGDISYLLPHLGLPTKVGTAVRGELVMRNGTFMKKWAAEFANPRNMVSGLTNRQTVHEAVKDMEFLVYEFIEPRIKPSQAFAKAKALGYAVAPFKVFPTLTEEKLLTLLKAARSNGKYEVDGLVIAVDKKTPVSTSDPAHTIAFKSDTEDDSATTTIIGLEWNLTRTGYYFPRILVEPVQLKGVTVRYASAKSAEFVKTNGIGVGAVVQLRRSGDVIPDIRAQDVIKKGKVTWPKSYEWDGANIRQPKGTTLTDDLRTMRISHFFKVMGIERFKDATVAKYVEAGYDSVIKIMRMTEAQFTSVEGVSRTAKVVYQQIQDLKAEGVELPTLMYASHVFGRALGTRKFTAITQAIPNILEKGLLPPAKLIQMVDDIPGFDVKQAQAFALGLPKFLKFQQLLKFKIKGPRKIVKVSRKLAGVAALFTGFRDKAASSLISKHGGTETNSIRSATVLLAKDVHGASSKLAMAQQLGVPVMTLQKFLTKYGLNDEYKRE